MSRSIKKGPFVQEALLKRVKEMNANNEKKVLKTWSRSSTIFPDFVGHTIAVHDGRKHVPVWLVTNSASSPPPAPSAAMPAKRLRLASNGRSESMATRMNKKAAAHKANRDMRPKAHARYIRISSRKCKIVLDLIRGKSVDQALAILMYTPKSAAPVLEKLLRSAIANAENNLNMDRGSLYVAEVYANQGPTLKRYRPKARGSATQILKRTSHLTIILDQAK